jgi:hypothetical protein
MSFENLTLTLPEKLSEESMNYVEFKGPLDRRARRVTFECEVLSEGITTAEFGHSVYCKVSDPILLCIETLQEIFSEKLEGYEIIPFVKSDAFFLKLPTINNRYKATIIPPTDPATPEKSTIVYGSVLETTLSFHGYINAKDKKAGIFVTVHRVVVDGGKKRRK